MNKYEMVILLIREIVINLFVMFGITFFATQTMVNLQEILK